MGATRSTSGTYKKYNLKIRVDQSLGKRLKFIWENNIKMNIINKELGGQCGNWIRLSHCMYGN